MKTNMYVIFDNKAKIYNKPFFQINDDVALRSAMDLLTDQNTEISRHPHDYIMFKIGTYDDTTAQIQIDELVSICRFHELQANLQLEQGDE